MVTVIVYNPFDASAVIAAAILKDNIEPSIAIDVTKIIPETGICYYWVGIDPVKYTSKFYDYDENKIHYVYVDKTTTDTVAPRGRLSGIFKRSTVVSSKNNEDSSENETELSPHVNSIVEQVCTALGIDYDKYRRLTYQASLFNEKDAKILDLTYVHKNIKAAQCVLSGRTATYEVEDINPDDIVEYMTEVQATKTSMTGAYQRCFIYDDSRTKRVLYTCINDLQYHLVQRLIRLSHRYFLNVVMTVNGIVAYTNLKEFTTVELKEEVLLLNA